MNIVIIVIIVIIQSELMSYNTHKITIWNTHIDFVNNALF